MFQRRLCGRGKRLGYGPIITPDNMCTTLPLQLIMKAQLTKINEQILDLKEAAPWVMTRQQEIDDFLAPQNQLNVLVPLKKTLGEKWSMCPWRAS